MMHLLQDSIRELKIEQALNSLAVKLLELEKSHKSVNKKLDKEERDEYTNQDFEVNERNDF